MNTKMAERTAQQVIAKGLAAQRQKMEERAALKEQGLIDHPLPPLDSNEFKKKSGTKGNPWLDRLLTVAPNISEAALESARAKLDAKYGGEGVVSVDSGTEDCCPRCGGLGAIRLNPDANPGEDDFGKVQRCPNEKFHAQARLKMLAKISNLSVPELEIRLSSLRPYHRPDEQYETEISLDDGTPLIIGHSNVEMIETFQQLARNPYGDAGMIFLMGPWGSGKTFAVMGLVNEINNNNKGPAMYITLPDLIGFLIGAYDDRNRNDEVFGNWSFDRRYNAVATAKVIVVDEFDFTDSKVRGTDHNLQLLQRWFDRRYRSGIHNQTLTVLVSNSPIENVGLGGVSSRASDGRFRTIFNTAPDMRPAQGRDNGS